MKKLLVIVFASFLIFGIAGVAAANLITNGDFETVEHYLGTENGIYLDELADGQWDVYDVIPGWAKYDGNGIEIQRSAVVAAYSPKNYVELDSESPLSNSGMVQFVNLTEGYYELSFWYRPRTNALNDNGINVLFMNENNVVLSVDGISSEIDEWTQYSVSLYAPSTDSWGIGFHATGLENEYGGFLDDIQLNAVPEPATLLLLGFGILSLVGLRRKE